MLYTMLLLTLVVHTMMTPMTPQPPGSGSCKLAEKHKKSERNKRMCKEPRRGLGMEPCCNTTIKELYKTPNAIEQRCVTKSHNTYSPA